MGLSGVSALQVQPFGGAPYDLYDQFITDRAAGAVHGTLAEPGPGTRQVTDPTSKIALNVGWLNLTSPGAGDTAHLHYLKAGAGFPRAAGRMLQFDIIPHDDGDQCILGFYDSATIALANTEHCFYFGSSARIFAYNGSAGSTNTGYTYAKNTLYRCRIVLQATGAKFYISGGELGTFGLVYTAIHTDNSQNTATLYPAAMAYNGDFDLDNILLPTSLNLATNEVSLDNDLDAAITAYQGTANWVHAGGAREADWAETASLTGVDASGRTYIMPGNAIWQDCTLAKIALNVHARDGTAWKFKVFRWNYTTTTYDYVDGATFTPAATGSQTHNISVDVQAGDIPALFLPDANNAVKVSDPNSRNIVLRLATGDISASNAFGTQHGDSNQLELDCRANRPYLATVGDSIMTGGGQQSWYAWADNHVEAASYMSCPGGTSLAFNCAPPYRLRTKVRDGTVLQYQNCGKHSVGSDWARTTGVPLALLAEPAILLIATGINDLIAYGNSWEDIEADLDAIKVLVDAASPSPALYLCEILPCTSATDAQAAAIRAANASLATWCAANDAALIRTHDPMAQLRPTTGEYDDILNPWDHDGVHLNIAGVDRLADLIYQELL
jgi:lysophospholipase L1-like esterase